MTYVTLLVALVICSVNAADQEEEARKYLDYANKIYAKKNEEIQNSEWAYATNITDETLSKKVCIQKIKVT